MIMIDVIWRFCVCEYFVKKLAWILFYFILFDLASLPKPARGTNNNKYKSLLWITNKSLKQVHTMGKGGGISYGLGSCGWCSCSWSCSDNESTTWLTSPTRIVKGWAKGAAIRRPGNSNSQQLPLNDSYWLWLLLEYASDGKAFPDCSKETLVTASTWTWVCEIRIHIISVDLQKPPLHVAGIPFTEKQKWKREKYFCTPNTRDWFSIQEKDRKY